MPATFSTPAGTTMVPLTVPPEETTSLPPERTSMLDATWPVETVTGPPLTAGC